VQANPPSVVIVKGAITVKVRGTPSGVENSIKIAVMFLLGWVVWHNAKTPNQACTGRLGTAARFASSISRMRGFEFFLLPSRVHAHLSATARRASSRTQTVSRPLLASGIVSAPRV
jgi:hypothetical protein